MNKEKQIEEMAKDVASTHIGTVKPDLTLTELGEVYKGEFILRIAKHLYNAGYLKASEVAEEIFAEIEAHFDKRIALYQTMKSRALLVGNEVEREYADTMIINLTIYKKEIAELKKKYTEGGERVAEDRKWISVEDRLPERNGRYLTHCLIEGQSLVCILHYSKVGGFNESTVTHWQPLPEPPKESEDTE